ncbi:MAG: helix-turn-helix transcriptional regulator [Ferruginibacter sp.]|nr:helix-turn-helix transcriptional regulator [Ferruginibacter sp.]
MQSDTLRLFRLAKNLKQKTVADLLGMSQPNYSDLENGKTKLNNRSAKKLADYYGVSSDAFLEGTPPTINTVMSSHNKTATNTAQYSENNKELLDPIITRMEILLNLLADEKEELATERRQLSEVFNKLSGKLGSSL